MKSNSIARAKTFFLDQLKSVHEFADKALQDPRNQKIAEACKLFLALTPGMIFISLGLCMLFAPKYLALFLCAFLLSFGLAALFLGHKINQIRIKFRKLSAQIEARVFIDPEALYNINSDRKESFETDAKEQLKTAAKDMRKASAKGDIVIQLADGKKVVYH